jgi:predicted O-methyltransferase YrrM
LTRRTGLVSTPLATAFPNSTIVSVEPDTENVNEHLAALEAADIQNNVICNTPLTTTLIHKLYPLGCSF